MGCVSQMNKPGVVATLWKRKPQGLKAAVEARTGRVKRALRRVFRRQAPKIAGQVTRAYEKVRGPAAKLVVPLARLGLSKDVATELDVDRILKELELEEFAAEIADELKPELERMFREAGTAAMEVANIDDTEAMTSLVNDEAISFADERAAELVGKKLLEDGSIIDNQSQDWAIDENTREMMRGLVASALEEGPTVQDLANAIEDSFAFSQDRAETIARTELATAHSQGTLRTWQASGQVIGKRWLLADTHPESDECDDNADEEFVAIDDDFPSGDDAPPAHPNCLCSLIPVLEGEEPDAEEEESEKVDLARALRKRADLCLLLRPAQIRKLN